jgi:alanine racemase
VSAAVTARREELAFVRPTWCEIELGAIEHNVRQLRDLLGAGVRIYVCLKGDASGCGAIEVARASERSGAHGFAFGNVDAAIACRRAGVRLPILVYPSCLPAAAPTLVRYSLSPTLSTLDDVALWDVHVPPAQRLPVFLKIDTGGFRAGAFPDEAAAVAKAIVGSARLKLAGVYGHSFFGYGVDNPDGASRHIGEFRKAIAAIDQAGIDVDIRMCSSSELVLNHPEADLNAVDPGRLICGIGFSSSADRKREWKAALVGLKSRLVMRKDLTHVGAVSPAPFVAGKAGLVVGLVPYGWSDGYPRQTAPGAHVLIRGRRAPLLGPVHSEVLRIDLTEIPDAEVGDEVVFLGNSGDSRIDLEQLATQWNTDIFDVFCRVGKSVPRVYLRA